MAISKPQQDPQLPYECDKFIAWHFNSYGERWMFIVGHHQESVIHFNSRTQSNVLNNVMYQNKILFASHDKILFALRRLI